MKEGWIMTQLHKKFKDRQVKELIKKYLNKENERKHIQQILGIGKSRFFTLIKKYQEDPCAFSIQYTRKKRTRSIAKSAEKHILKELSIEKKLIKDKNVPVRSYNYSYIKDRLENEYKQKVSLPTIINRAKKNGFYLKKPKRTIHDREVLTHYIGELIQHDSSYHLWAPDARKKWYLITSLDDCSRFMLYAKLLAKETSWAHISALEATFLKYGLPFSYYVDSHSIFRFVQGRDSVWRKHHLLTDDVDTQWKQVLDDCNVKVTYALSPQAKGKIERPYGWLQDRLVRTCVRENITDIRGAQKILNQEVRRYNYRQVHSTTLEIPHLRFKRALKDKKSLFREFQINPPFESTKDIFCLRTTRCIDAYRKISINNLQLKVHNATPHDIVTLRIYQLTGSVSEIRFWCKDKLLDVKRIKNTDLKGVHF
jgi:transposase